MSFSLLVISFFIFYKVCIKSSALPGRPWLILKRRPKELNSSEPSNTFLNSWISAKASVLYCAVKLLGITFFNKDNLFLEPDISYPSSSS